MADKDTSVSLVLGSGGARGLAHIGVIAELEARGYRIASIAGCSIGALIGGIYAAGKLDAYTEWVSEISKLDMVALLDLAWQNDGLVKGDKIINKLVDLVGDQRIEDLPIPFTAVATDITHGTEVWMSTGRLFNAVRASISLPLFFTPFEYRDAKLIDGGCLNPVPIAPTWRDETDLTIAVNLGGEPDDELPVEPEQLREPVDKSTVHGWVTAVVDELKNSVKARARPDFDAYDVANQAFDAMQSSIARHKLAAYPPDIAIEIPRNACGTLEFDRAREMIQLGRTRTREALG